MPERSMIIWSATVQVAEVFLNIPKNGEYKKSIFSDDKDDVHAFKTEFLFNILYSC